MKPDNGCNDCKFFVGGDCRANPKKYFDSRSGEDIVFYVSPNSHRGGRRHCSDHELYIPLWKTIWDKIRRNK